MLILRKDPYRQMGGEVSQDYVRCGSQAHRIEPTGQTMAGIRGPVGPDKGPDGRSNLGFGRCNVSVSQTEDKSGRNSCYPPVRKGSRIQASYKQYSNGRRFRWMGRVCTHDAHIMSGHEENLAISFSHGTQ